MQAFLNRRPNPQDNAHEPAGADGALGVGADAMIVFFAVWTFAGHMAYFVGLSFAQWWWLGGPAAGAAALWWAIRNRSALPSSPRRSARDDFSNYTLLLAIVLAVVLTLCLNRPDQDDECYLGLAVTALDNPATRLDSRFTGAFCAIGYVTTSFDFLRAASTWATGVPLLASYYLIWPGVIAALVVIFQFRLLRQTGVRNLTLALAVFLIVMLAWGDAHPTPANFGFVRLYQGKGGLIWVTIPAAIFYWLRITTSRDRRAPLLLLCAIVGGIGFSPTGVPAGTFLLGLFWLATLMQTQPARPTARVLLVLSLIAFYPIVIGLTLRYRLGNFFGGVVTNAGVKSQVVNTDMIELMMGDGLRSLVALACAAALPLLLGPSPSRRPLMLFSMLCSGLLLFPWTSILLGSLGYGSFAWRWMFVIPFVPAIIIAVDRLIELSQPAIAGYALVSAIGFVYLFASPRWVVSCHRCFWVGRWIISAVRLGPIPGWHCLPCCVCS